MTQTDHRKTLEQRRQLERSAFEDSTRSDFRRMRSRPQKRVLSSAEYGEALESIADDHLNKLHYGPESEDDFVKRKLERWDQEHPPYYGGRYEDLTWTETNYQYQYLVALNRYRPEIFEELRPLVPVFQKACARLHWTSILNKGGLPGPIPEFLTEWFFSNGERFDEDGIALSLLLSSVYEWANRNLLAKRWVIDYALASIETFCSLPGAEILVLPDLRRVYLPLPDLSLNVAPVGDETEAAFVARASRKLAESLRRRRESCSVGIDRALRNGEVKKVSGRPLDPERVEWLAWWNSGATYQQIADKFGRSVSTMQKAIDEFSKMDVDLPVRIGKAGRPSASPLTSKPQ